MSSTGENTREWDTMHAVLIEVDVEGVARELGLATLREQIVPAIAGLPGFQSGTWLTGNEKGKGLSLTLGDTDANARTKIEDAGGGAGYGLVAAAEKGIGGKIGPAQDGGGGQVTFYVEVDEPAAYLRKAEELGGQTVVPATELEQFGLTFAFFADPEGHVVGLSKGAVQ